MNVLANAANAMTSEWVKHLRAALDEDGWQWDWSARAASAAGGAVLPARGRECGAKVIAKAPGIWAGEQGARAVARVADEMGLELEVSGVRADGTRVMPGDIVCLWSGGADAVLALERPFLNLASYVSGIATETARFVAAVASAGGSRKAPRVTPTRKTYPGYRALAVHGVLCGGGHPHRTSLSGGVLLKENHIALAGSVGAAIQAAREVAPHLLKVGVEVRDLKELGEALSAGAEAILLDNFTPDEIRKAVEKVRSSGVRTVLEASGGITPENAADFAVDGLDVISSGALTHSVRALDLSLLVSHSA